VRRAFRDSVEEVRQASTHHTNRKIFVISAGNNGLSTYADGTPVEPEVYASPDIDAGLGVYFDGLDHVLAVVALKENGEIADYSNRCGVAKAFCIAAPGFIESAPGWITDGHYRSNFIGTSSAAPIVSGALLAMRDFFTNPEDGELFLGNTEIVLRLLATAHKGEIRDGSSRRAVDADPPDPNGYSDSDTYGQGLLDLQAALTPRGSVRVLTGADVGGSSLPLAGTRLGIAGGASGDALARAIGARRFGYVDELDAPFFFPAGALIDDGGVAGDHAVRLEVARAAQTGGLGETHPLGQRGVGQSPVVLQLPQDLAVRAIEVGKLLHGAIPREPR